MDYNLKMHCTNMTSIYVVDTETFFQPNTTKRLVINVTILKSLSMVGENRRKNNVGNLDSLIQTDEQNLKMHVKCTKHDDFHMLICQNRRVLRPRYNG